MAVADLGRALGKGAGASLGINGRGIKWDEKKLDTVRSAGCLFGDRPAAGVSFLGRFGPSRDADNNNRTERPDCHSKQTVTP